MELEIKNAVIENAEIDISDRGFLIANITLDYGGCGKVFGGYALYLPKSFRNHELKNVAGHFIYRVIELSGADKWESIVGKTIRVKANHCGIKSIGHIVKDDWFTPSDDFQA